MNRIEHRTPFSYYEHGTLNVENGSLCFSTDDRTIRIPIESVGSILLGPGTKITHAAARLVNDFNCLVCWSASDKLRTYASLSGPEDSYKLLRQSKLYNDEKLRRRVACNMYRKRFVNKIDDDASIETLRGMEGSRVRSTYKKLAEHFGIKWEARRYDLENWDDTTPINKAISCANVCLYAICLATILSIGYSPAIGFIHTGKMLSFVYDISDFYKTKTTLPIAFSVTALSEDDIERRVRLACREHLNKMSINKMIDDIEEVLNVDDTNCQTE